MAYNIYVWQLYWPQQSYHLIRCRSISIWAGDIFSASLRLAYIGRHNVQIVPKGIWMRFFVHKISRSRCAINYSFLCYSFKMHSFRRNIYDFIILILCLTLYNLKTSNMLFQDFAPFALHVSWKAYNSPYIKCNCRGLEKIPIMCTLLATTAMLSSKLFVCKHCMVLKTRPGDDQIR